MDRPAAQSAQAVKNSEAGDGAAGEQAGSHAEDQGKILLVKPVDDANGLEDTEAAEGQQRDAFVGFLAPDGDDLGHEEQGITAQTEAEDDGDDLLHAAPPSLLNRSALRALALAASSSRVRGGAVVSSEASRREETDVI